MTLLASWVGVYTHGVSSAYIAADSRITWDNLGQFDHGRKVFAFRNSPDILGYCGDVLFPTMVLSQITEMADHALLFSPNASCKDRFKAIKEKLVQQFANYPKMVASITADMLQVSHISRDPKDNLRFACWLVQWIRKTGWSGKAIELPKQSGVLFALGSGAREFHENLARYKTGPNQGTSRCLFHCFCDTLFNIKDRRCGGAPQLVGIYRKPDSGGISYGIIRGKRRYFLGAQIGTRVGFGGVEWRNDLFEVCDGRSMKKRPNAQPQPDSLRRK